jgi:hypothetical protein
MADRALVYVFCLFTQLRLYLEPQTGLADLQTGGMNTPRRIKKRLPRIIKELLIAPQEPNTM